ncbi:hypothetical protein [Siphonobacter sp.]|uniref:hypothetical protein n=1 Tax=Siphonobacter sp. TaxID=1869184 RepID=UPI003B3A7030
MNIQGNNWMFFGKKNTGKTFEALEFAKHFFQRDVNPKRIIVFDHSNNTSYKEITDVIPMERLQWQLPKKAIVKVQSDDFDTFAEYCLMYVRNAVVVIDDSSAFFQGNVRGTRLKFLKSPKNNGNEYMFQCHSVRETAPLLLENTDIFVLKETRDDANDLPTKLVGRNRIIPLMNELIEENDTYPSGQKWATRVYDQEEDTIWFKDLRIPLDDVESVFDTYGIMPARDYLNAS